MDGMSFADRLAADPHFAERYRAWQKEKVVCSCGATIARSSAKRHEKTASHRGEAPARRATPDPAVAAQRREEYTERMAAPVQDNDMRFLRATWCDAPWPAKTPDGDWSPEFSAWQKRKIQCFCGKVMGQASMKRHLNTNAHQLFTAANPDALDVALERHYGLMCYDDDPATLRHACPFAVEYKEPYESSGPSAPAQIEIE